jgi:GYF domain 2
MQLHIIKDGQQRGPYSQMQIVEMLRAGELSDGDLAWQMGMATWMPLGEVQDFKGEGSAKNPTAAGNPASQNTKRSKMLRA